MSPRASGPSVCICGSSGRLGPYGNASIILMNQMDDKGVTAVLLISCPDQKGVVAAVSDFIFRNDGNIIHADPHTDQEQHIFLQRVEWELDGFRLPRRAIAD